VFLSHDIFAGQNKLFLLICCAGKCGFHTADILWIDSAKRRRESADWLMGTAATNDTEAVKRKREDDRNERLILHWSSSRTEPNPNHTPPNVILPLVAWSCRLPAEREYLIHWTRRPAGSRNGYNRSVTVVLLCQSVLCTHTYTHTCEALDEVKGQWIRCVCVCVFL